MALPRTVNSGVMLLLYLQSIEGTQTRMTRQTTIKLSIILALIAAALAFSASVIDYVKNGKINLTPILATLFLLALVFSLSRVKGAGEPK